MRPPWGPRGSFLGFVHLRFVNTVQAILPKWESPDEKRGEHVGLAFVVGADAWAQRTGQVTREGESLLVGQGRVGTPLTHLCVPGLMPEAKGRADRETGGEGHQGLGAPMRCGPGSAGLPRMLEGGPGPTLH